MTARREVREALAAAADAVEGVSCSPYFVSTTTPGAAFVRWDRSVLPNPFGFVVHWNVVVLLPQDMAAAEQFAEDVVPALTEALRDHLVVTSVEPQQLSINGVGVLPAVFINGHREE